MANSLSLEDVLRREVDKGLDEIVRLRSALTLIARGDCLNGLASAPGALMEFAQNVLDGLDPRPPAKQLAETRGEA